MKIMLFTHDLAGLWMAELKLMSIPFFVVGTGIGWMTRWWLLCPAVSFLAAVCFLLIVPFQQRLHHELTVREMLIWAAVAVLPPILVPTSLGYAVARWLRNTRQKPQPIV